MRLNRWMRLGFWLGLVASGGAWANFDTRPVDQFTIADGLSQDSAWAMTLDSQGFLWLGTEDGLNRFDGQDFRVFRRDDKGGNSVADNFVTALLADQDAIYVGTRAGTLQRLDLRTERFDSLPGAIAAQFQGNSVDELLLLGPGRILVGTKDRGLVSLTFQDGQFIETGRWVGPASGLPSNQVRTLHLTRSGQVWVGTSKGACRLQDLGPRCIQPDWPGLRQLAKSNVGAIITDAREQLWVAGVSEGVVRISRDGNRFDQFLPENSGLPSKLIEVMKLDSLGRVWVGTKSGVARFDEQCNCFIKPRALGRSPDEPRQLVLSMLEDASGGLWVGYFNLGLERIALDDNGIRHYQPSAYSSATMGADQVRAILPIGDNSYLLGTFGDGAYALDTDPDTGLIATLKPLLQLPDQDTARREVWTLALIDRKLYIGSNGGLHVLDLDTRAVNPIKIPGQRMVLRQLLHDPHHDVLWLGMEDGLCRLQLADGSARCLNADPNTPGHLSDRYVFSLHLDRQGRLWAGTWNGLDEVDPERMLARPVSAEETGIASALIFDIAESQSGQIWLGSADGLVRFTPGSAPEVYRERQGLSNGVIYGVEFDADDTLWLSSSRGLMRFDPRSKVITAYDQRDGLQSNQFFYGAHGKDDHGRLLFGGIKGLNRIDPNRVPRTLRPPKVFVTGVSVLGQTLRPGIRSDDLPVLDAPPNYLDVIRLGPEHNQLGIEFAAPDFDQPRLLNFEYQLSGFDPRWQQLGGRRFVSFTNLRAGDYELLVRARNRFGELSLSDARLKIQVAPPAYETWWFRTLMVLISAGLIWVVFAWRTRDLRQQRLHLEQEVIRRTDEVRAQNERLAAQQAELERANRELFQLSNRDPLTGAYNRRYIQERLARALASHGQLAIAIVDIDFFKRINDQYGHLAGDDCLRHVVACMSQVLADRAEFARWGGEEFLIGFEQLPGADVGTLLEQLRTTLAERPALADGKQVAMTISIGWCDGAGGQKYSLAEQIRRADTALYRAKEQGRNQVVASD
ncbi:hypothetical protein C7S18_14510 [Ahniella affigens]|uniref:diguanylate cyclase n=1 Tax=Ahniella affigens TaxID=2021234 RepID=A0A2P1PU12_9GAMM|nr:ligand-binding sensor domain-containing diguanylate cyclase [Ahniella affigens]AVP98328.1 hypothetical protein C7S18_14510 [Ahniella affigens]